jgi:O-antigen/teichoic acid export membrane protein
MLKSLWQRVGGGGFSANASLTAATNLVMALLGMGSGILAARLLGPRGRGELAAIQTWPSFIATIAMLGMIEATIYYSACDPERTSRYVGSGSALALIASIPFMLCGYLAMPFLLAAQSSEAVSAARWYLLIAPIYALVALPAHSLRGRGDFAAWNALRASPNFVWLSVLATAWLMSVRSAATVADTFLALQALMFLPFSYVVAKRSPGSFCPEARDFGKLIRYGIPCALTGLPQNLNFRLDQMLMAAMLPSRALGEYAVAVAWSGAAAPLINSVGSTLLPSVASSESRHDGVSIFAKGVRMASLLALVACLFLMAMTPLAIVALFGSNFRTALPPALVLMPAASLLGLNFVLEEGLRGLGHPYPVLHAELVGLAVTGLALALTLRPLGTMGAAFSSLAGYSTVTVALLASARRHTGTSPASLLWPRADELKLALRRLGYMAYGLTASID